MNRSPHCPDCEPDGKNGVDRREFVQRVGKGAAVVSLGTLGPNVATARPRGETGETSESLVKKLYDSLSKEQRQAICFAWDHVDKERGLLRTHVSNNWSIVNRRQFRVGGPFFTNEQQDLIEAIFFGMYDKEWHDRIRKQLKDDAGGYGRAQTIAIFGDPATDRFQFVMTGRHLTIRCDGKATSNMAFGGPVFYGHAAQGFHEKPDHPGNVFWPQAKKANSLYAMLDGKQRKKALANPAPYESEVAFRGPRGAFPGIPVAELSPDQKEQAQAVLESLVEPYRKSDREHIQKLLSSQGGLEACSLAFYSKDGSGSSVDIGNDGVWDVWRLEGPSFVWHFRGDPHVHVWVNVANDPSIPLNASG